MNIQSGRREIARSKFVDDWSVVFTQTRTDSNGKLKPGHFGKFLEQLMKHNLYLKIFFSTQILMM